jgi:ATP-dependent DNA helicase DinG
VTLSKRSPCARTWRACSSDRAFFDAVRRASPGTGRGDRGGAERKARDGRFSSRAGEGQAVLEGLDLVEAAFAQLPEPPEEVRAVERRAGEIRQDLRLLLRADDPDYVFYVEQRGRGVFLRASPIDVSSIVRSLLLDRLHGTVLTSATLAVDESFSYIRSRRASSGQEVASPRSSTTAARRCSTCRAPCPTRGRRSSPRARPRR